MVVSRAGKAGRQGTTAVECAVVYPVAMMLIVGTIVVGVGNFQYEQLQSLAREGARYASVRGPNYAQANSCSSASASDVLTHVQSLSAGMPGLNCIAASYSAAALPCTVSVTLTYTWTPGAFFGPMTWTSTSTMPVTY